jgi:ATP-dependent Clp protease ATP-binding subunit ClpX
MINDKEHDKVKCSFCGRDGSEVASMVAGPDVYICDNCVKSSVEILKENIAAYKNNSIEQGVLTPDIVHKKLNEHIIGQDQAKKVLSVAELAFIRL